MFLIVLNPQLSCLWSGMGGSHWTETESRCEVPSQCSWFTVFSLLILLWFKFYKYYRMIKMSFLFLEVPVPKGLQKKRKQKKFWATEAFHEELLRMVFYTLIYPKVIPSRFSNINLSLTWTQIFHFLYTRSKSIHFRRVPDLANVPSVLKQRHIQKLQRLDKGLEPQKLEQAFFVGKHL